MTAPPATARRNGRLAAEAADAAPSPSAAPAVIETRGLTKVYPGGVRAVDGLDLVVHQGEIFGLLGPNGAGKTTTAGMLTTRVTPTSGSALVGGIDVVRRPAAAKRLLGVVPQTNTLDRSLTVWENLYFHGRFFGMDAKTAKSESTRLLHQFRLAERAEAPVAALSGGMAQRLMVARAVMHRPSVLFLDEPTAGLDPQSRIALWEILGELHVDGQTILLTTHYMEEADQLCDRVAIIDQGRIVALDTPAGLKRSVGADSTLKVSSEGDIEALAALLRKEIKGATDATVIDGTVLLGVQGAAGVVPTVVEVARKHGFHVTDLSVSETTLETVFINLTGKDLRE
jgi:ABC-2 type transport system ATP-binding protein